MPESLQNPEANAQRPQLPLRQGLVVGREELSALCCLGRSWFALVPFSLLGSSSSLTCNLWKAVRNCLRHPADISPSMHTGTWLVLVGEAQPQAGRELRSVSSLLLWFVLGFFAVWNGQRINPAHPTVSMLSPSACPGGFGGARSPRE